MKPVYSNSFKETAKTTKYKPGSCKRLQPFQQSSHATLNVEFNSQARQRTSWHEQWPPTNTTAKKENCATLVLFDCTASMLAQSLHIGFLIFAILFCVCACKQCPFVCKNNVLQDQNRVGQVTKIKHRCTLHSWSLQRAKHNNLLAKVSVCCYMLQRYNEATNYTEHKFENVWHNSQCMRSYYENFTFSKESVKEDRQEISKLR